MGHGTVPLLRPCKSSARGSAELSSFAGKRDSNVIPTSLPGLSLAVNSGKRRKHDRRKRRSFPPDAGILFHPPFSTIYHCPVSPRGRVTLCGIIMEKVNLVDKLGSFKEHWSPKIVGDLNGHQVKLVKFQGPFVWHHHDHEDE